MGDEKVRRGRKSEFFHPQEKRNHRRHRDRAEILRRFAACGARRKTFFGMTFITTPICKVTRQTFSEAVT